MSEDLTGKPPKTDSEKLNVILTTTQSLEARFERLETRVSGIDSRLKNLERTVEEKLYDTRPIWEKVVAEITKLQEGQQRLEEGQEKLKTVVAEIRTSQRDSLRRMTLLHETLFTIQSDYRDIYDRVRGLEHAVNPPNSST